VTQWASGLRDNQLSGSNSFKYTASLANLRKLPTQTLAYWAPPGLLRAYETLPPLEPTYGEVRQGLATGDDERFLRYWWEVPESEIGEGKRWVPFAKGGDYSPFYESLLRVIDWEDGGKTVRDFAGSVMRNEKDYFRSGLTYPNICDRFHVRALERGTIFGHKGSSIFTLHEEVLLAYLNSRVAQALLLVQSPTRNFEVGQVRRLPVPKFTKAQATELAAIAASALASAKRYAGGNELDRRYQRSWSESAVNANFREAITCAADQRNTLLNSIQEQIDLSTRLTSDVLELTSSDWEIIFKTFGPELRVDENVKSVGTVSTSMDPLTTIREQAYRYVSGVIRGLLGTNALLREQSLCERAVRIMQRTFTESDLMQEFVDIVGSQPAEWICQEYIAYHTRLHLGRPRLLCLASTRRRIVFYTDVLLVTAQDLRDCLATEIHRAERDGRARLTEGNAKARRSAVELLEDVALFRSTFNAALGQWNAKCDDCRERIPLFAPLIDYSLKQLT